MTVLHHRSFIEERFADRRSVPAEPVFPDDITAERGDHALNLDMMPDLPLKAGRCWCR